MGRLALPCLIVVVMATILAVGCSGGTATTFNKKATTVSNTSSAEKVTVAEIGKNPSAYDNVVVTTEGNYAVGYCSACFLLKDGVSAVRVEVSDTCLLYTSPSPRDRS